MKLSELGQRVYVYCKLSGIEWLWRTELKKNRVQDQENFHDGEIDPRNETLTSFKYFSLGN